MLFIIVVAIFVKNKIMAPVNTETTKLMRMTIIQSDRQRRKRGRRNLLDSDICQKGENSDERQ